MKILIQIPTWLGDAVMATPAIENIISHYKASEIILVGSKLSIELLNQHPKISQSIILNKNFFALFRFARKTGRVDVFYSFRNTFSSKFLKFFVISKKKFQFNKKKFLNQHQVEKYNSFVNRSIGLNNLPGPLFLHPKKNNIKVNRKVIGINPGATYGSAKRWYPEEFAKVASSLSSYYDIRIYGGPNEKKFAQDIEELLKLDEVTNFKNLSGKTSIQDLVSEISKLDLFITGDSGPMHIAAALEVPTISIFGPTNILETSQWMNKKSINIQKNLECQPCMKRACPLGHHDCMRLIKSEEVLVAVDSIF